MWRFCSVLIFSHLASAIQPIFADVARGALKKYDAPLFSVIVDGVQSGTYAFTDAPRERAYIDFNRFRNAPNSLANVLHHEVEHLKGRDHNEIPLDIMSYRLTVDSNGAVVDDDHIWA